MFINLESKTIALELSDLQKGFNCPICGEFFKPNGTGPSKSKLATWLLQSTFAELVTGGEPAYFHDTAFLICPEGWAVFYGAYVAKDFHSANKTYHRMILDRHKDAKGLAKVFLYVLAKRNYFFVKYLGKSSYCHQHK
jgi:hypothetical protein